MPAVSVLKLAAETFASLPRNVLGFAGTMIFRSAFLVVMFTDLSKPPSNITTSTAMCAAILDG
jgi:hypothetical protein